MKTLLNLMVIVVVLVLAAVPGFSVQVVKQFEETSYYLKDVDFINSSVGWAVGEPHWDQTAKEYKGTIIKTSDGGDTWTAQEAGVTETLRGVDFVDADNGWAVGANGTILHTTNGGNNWAKQTVATTDEFRGLVFIDANNGWATAIRITHYDDFGDPDNWEGSIWHTNNGGQTWLEQSVPSNASILNRIKFIDTLHGWVVGVKYIGDDPYGDPQHRPSVYHTSNGGQSWEEQYSPDMDITFTGVDFIDVSNGWVVGFKTSSVVEGGVAFHTTDGGESWVRQNAGVETFAHIEDVYFLDLNKGYAAGFNPLVPGPSLWRTLDGGATWEVVYLDNNEGELLYGVAVNSNRVVVVGTHDFMSISADPWGTFGPYHENSFSQKYINIHYRFEDVFFIDENNGWAVGKRSFLPKHWGQVIFHTQNGGLTWETQYEKAPNLTSSPNDTFRLDHVFFLDSQNGWAVGGSDKFNGYYGAILHTTNGGLTWNAQGTELYALWDLEFFAVQFLDSLNGWALAGKNPSISNISLAHTTDGGTHWGWVDTGIEDGMSVGFATVQGDVYFTDAQHGWAAGGLGEVVHTEDGGVNWVQQNLSCGYPTCPWSLFAVELLNNQEGWIAGEGLYHTTDGGSNWAQKDIGVNVAFQDIKFIDSLYGWLAGDQGVLMYTNSGGSTWNSVESGTYVSLRGISFANPGKGWAVGDDGTIISILADMTPPNPNPMTWATPPDAAGATSISMVATTATDTGSPPVSYYFDFVDSPTGGTGGADSGWQSSTSYTNAGLQPNHQYGYQVKARDSASTPNETSPSSPIVYTYTRANAPGAASFSNITETSIRANWTANGNPSGTQYYGENTTNGTNSGWTTNTYWDSSGLACGTSYSFRLKAKNGDGVDTAWTDLGTQATQACPIPPVINPISNDSIVEGTPYTGPTPSLSQGTPPVTWSLVSGPNGMGINSSTGVVSWATPTASGSPHTITIQATNAAGSDTKSWLLTVAPPPGVLSVTPPEGLSSSGHEGGPFSPSSKDYTLENIGASSINWTASKTQSWVTLSATGGSLAAGASTTVSVSINSAANSLPAATYNDTVTFTNTTNGVGNTSRGVMLTVESCPAPAVPTNPSPGDKAVDISIATDLDWDDSTGATSYDVYFGTTYPPEKVGTVSNSAYDPGLLNKDSIYYWRIVAKNECGDTTGDLWQFTTAQQPIDIILHKDGALWSSETGWNVTTPPYYPGSAYARDLELLADRYLILHKDGAIWDSVDGWVISTPPYYPNSGYAVALKVTGSGEEIVLHRDGAFWSSATGWELDTPPYYPGSAYAKALEIREDGSYVILHKEGAVYDSATGWVASTPPYYPGNDWARGLKLDGSGYIILHKDGAFWSTSCGWLLTTPPYYPNSDYARALELVGSGYQILHKDGAIYDSVTGWVTTMPPYYPGSNYAVDLEVQ